MFEQGWDRKQEHPPGQGNWQLFKILMLLTLGIDLESVTGWLVLLFLLAVLSGVTYVISRLALHAVVRLW